MVDITRLGKEAEVVESVVWKVIETDPARQNPIWCVSEVRLVEVFTGGYTHDVPHAEVGSTDTYGDIFCMVTPLRWCGTTRRESCHIHHADKNDLESGIDYAEYVKLYKR